MLVMVGDSNAVNLTDGLDGLATMPVIIAAATFALLAYLVFGEGFRPLQLVGFVVLLAGITVAARDEGHT